MSDIQMLPIAVLLPHPDNPRKDVGDITELTESIRKNGVMQNLTVIPVEGGAVKEQGIQMYHVLIGNRRLAAAKKALGATGADLPCKIVTGLSSAEQVSIRLAENMQREDLTIAEQAFGFQLMLNLGESVDSIAEKSGFSKTTVNHRLELAKLDKATLEMMTDPEREFQISLRTLQMLEKVEDIEKRNAILSKADDERDVVWGVSQAVREQNAKKNRPIVIAKLEAAGIERAPEKLINARYSDRVEEVDRVNLDNAEECQAFEAPADDNGPVFWMDQYRSIVLLKKRKKVKREMTLEEIREIEAQKKFREAMVIMEEICTDRADFVRQIIKGDVKLAKDVQLSNEQIMGKLFDFMLRRYVTVDVLEATAHFLQEASRWDIKDDQVAEVFGTLSDIQKMVLVIDSTWFDKYTRAHFKYTSGRDTKDGEKHHEWINLLNELYLFRITDPVKEAILDGSSELYTKVDANA